MSEQNSTIKNEWEEKLRLRQEAEESVVAAFAQMGAHPAPKQREQIDKIIEMHDPAVVESAMQRLIENPTENMIKLHNSISSANDEQSFVRSSKRFGTFTVVGAGLLAALGIVLGTHAFETSHLVSLIPAALNIAGSGALMGIGAPFLARQFKYQGEIDQKTETVQPPLISACIDDLLHEVELQETQNKDLGKVGAK